MLRKSMRGVKIHFVFRVQQARESASELYEEKNQAKEST